MAWEASEARKTQTDVVRVAATWEMNRGEAKQQTDFGVSPDSWETDYEQVYAVTLRRLRLPHG